jgi:Putative beta-barrel porin 2
MLCTKSNRIRTVVFLIIFSVCSAWGTRTSLAQEPPTVPLAGQLPPVGNAIPVGSWLLYPTLNLFSQYSDNYFLSPTAKISGIGFGITPAMTAQWTDGIHSTTLYGNFQGIQYPTAPEINTTDGEATFTQRYSPLPDLSFSVSGDYTHRTIAPGLQNGIQPGISAPTITLLPNGNSVLPNGSIVSPTGQIVGQSTSALTVNGVTVVNPYDQYTGTARVDKIFSDGILSLGASTTRVSYEQQASQDLDFTATSFTEDASFWLGPVFYIFSNGAFAKDVNTAPNPSIDIYRIVGGVGTRQFGLFRASAYFGHQGSESAGQPAGGNVYGGALAYYPTADWTISAHVDETINISSQTTTSIQALTLPVLTPAQIPLSSSVKLTTATVQSSYIISPKWTITGSVGYTHVDEIGSPIIQNFWFVDTSVKYDIWRNMTLTLEYQYTNIASNEPLTSTSRNFIVLTAAYRF